MLINKFSFQLVVQNLNTRQNYTRSQLLTWLTTQYSIEENYKRKVFPFEQLFNWLKTELCECERCSLVKTYSRLSRTTPGSVCTLRGNMSSGAL